MKRVLLFLVPVVLIAGFAFNAAMKHQINWKKLDTKASVITAIDKYIHTGDDISTDYKFLENERHEFIQQNGDTSIFFHSPYIPVHFGAMVSRKWMFTFHYVDKKLTRYEVEEGLLGP
ncbi:MAG TPA: hypothetical protein VL651_17305 [Bacteroidia bacterium]|jgi:hypothetical protein|nr:hypothetical protein [Bacteroidia bacterium]